MQSLMLETQHLFLRQGKFDKPGAQVPGKLFSPCEISKKLSHHFLLHFWIDMGSYDHQAKIRECFIEAPETLPNILPGGSHRNPYQFKNAIKSGGTVFCLHHLG